MAFVNFIVEPDWLQQCLNSDFHNIRTVDATWLMPGAEDSLEKGCLKDACFFDLDAIAAPHSELKHMLPSSRQFEQFNRENGIENQDHVICYDRHGMFSAPRLWWTYRMFGHEKVSEMGLDISLEFKTADKTSTYKPQKPLSGVIGFKELNTFLDSDVQIIDARPEGRFCGTSPEPRAGLRSGHMPGAISLPFGSLRTGTKFSDLGEISTAVGKIGIDLNKPIVTTCGSGITAAGLALLFHQLGADDIRVYDASWAEWGASYAPIEI